MEQMFITSINEHCKENHIAVPSEYSNLQEIIKLIHNNLSDYFL